MDWFIKVMLGYLINTRTLETDVDWCLGKEISLVSEIATSLSNMLLLCDKAFQDLSVSEEGQNTSSSLEWMRP